RRTLWRGIVAAEGLEGYDSIGSAGMAIQIHNKEIAAAQLDAGHRARVGIPPSLELSRVGGCGLAPSGDGRLLVQFLRRVVPRHQGRKDEDAVLRKNERNVEVAAHGSTPVLETMTVPNPLAISRAPRIAESKSPYSQACLRARTIQPRPSASRSTTTP